LSFLTLFNNVIVSLLFINRSGSIDITTVRFIDVFLNGASQYISHKEVTSIRSYNKSWFDSAFQCTIRDKLQTKALKTNTFNFWNQCKQQRNIFNNMKKPSEIKYSSSLDEQVENYRQKNPEYFWKFTKSSCSPRSNYPLLFLKSMILLHIDFQTKKQLKH